MTTTPDSEPTARGTDDPGAAQARRPSMSCRAVFLLSLAVFAQESVWNFYDAQVPASLQQYLLPAALIGFVMGVDNVLGIVLQPLMGHLSDRLRRRGGSRLPIILVGAPLAAIPFVLIPWAGSLPVLLLFVISFAFIANCFKAVTEALLPDYICAERRSRANGFIKIATSLTIISSSLVSLLVVDRSLQLAFAIPAAFMVVCFAVVAVFLRRIGPAPSAPTPDVTGEPEETPPGFLRVFRDAVTDRGRLVLLLGIVCFAGSWAATRALNTPYAIEVLGVTRGAGGGFSLPGAIAFLLAAAPIAYLSDRVGQTRMIAYGIGVFIAGQLGAFLWQTTTGTLMFLAVSSVGYATFSINAVVAIWNSAPSDRNLGAYTGLFNVAQSIGAALGPAVLGASVDLTGWSSMYLNSAVLALVALAVFTHLARRATRRTV